MELKLCKIPTIGTQSESQTLPTGNISLGSPIVFSGWVLHQIASQKRSYLEKKLLKLCFEKNERQRQKEFRVLKKSVVKLKMD
ncbi:hypothetical protein hp908_1142 [Helicobacter pylori 908]|nr:hypothetical protein hp908_1142 [Helicobacter pylori 908]ADZ50209.1 hypothetical protein hp2017_1100 [Helicobacter pylori 2017]ADZ51818.1 hypothetical protein hp2018_1104 [Helicobacter pylori 2018]